MDIHQRFFRLLEAVEEERKAEEAFFQNMSVQKSMKEKTEEGFVWYPLEILSTHYTLGDYLEVRVKPKNTDPGASRHKFKVGVSVLLFNSQKEVEPLKGVVSHLSKGVISILTHGEIEDIEAFQKGLTGLELMYDEKPYQVMKTALQQVIQSTKPKIQIWKKALNHQKIEDNQKTYDVIHPADHPGLNESQKEALHTALNANYLSVIHGPPGTGKTTTLVALVKDVLKTEKRVLVCASSNNAVDILAARLHVEGVKVLRIGNVTRIHDNITDLTLAEKIRNHPDWTTIKKMKIQADQIMRKAGQYKRSFTPEAREERKALKKEAYDIRNWSRELENRLSYDILHESEVITTTLISASHSLLDKMYFPTLIIDEASQALEPECWNAMLKADRVIFAGDHLQLPPTVKSNKAMMLGLSETILDHLMGNIHESTLLNVQYRMHHKILDFSNIMFYQGLLRSADNVENRTLPNDTETLVFIDTAGCSFDEENNPQQKSYKNPGEYFILREYLIHKKEILLGADIGIISPYAEQVRHISSETEGDVDLAGLDIEINTIDGFQGQEKDVIIISLVRSNDRNEIGFLKDERRLNVAMTRARKKLIIIGDSATIGKDSLYDALLSHIEKNGTMDSAWNYMQNYY